MFQGDQGAPLVIGNTIIGVGSAAREAMHCDDVGYVTVYTRVSKYVKWINGIMRTNI